MDQSLDFVPEGEEYMALSGPFTLMEMKIAARLLREKRTKGELQTFLSPAKQQHEDVNCNTPGSTLAESTTNLFSKFASPVMKPSETHQEPEPQKKDDVVDVAKIVHVATPMPEKVMEYESRTWSSGKKLFPTPPAMKTPDTARLEDQEEADLLVDEGPVVIADEIAQEVLEETEQVIIQEFSLEEAHFSGCNLSGLNLSFIETGNDDPLKTEQPKSPSKEQTPQDIPMEEPSDLFTLACISDLAEKLEVVEIKDVIPETPAQVKKISLSHLYSPISPADLSSQYLDAVDESLGTEKKSQLVPDEVIDAIVSLNSANTHPVPAASEESSEFVSAVMQPEESSLTKSEEDSFLQEASICNNENIADISSSSLVSSASSTQKENLSLLNDTLDEMDMILSMGVGSMNIQEQDEKSPPASKDIEVQNHARLSIDAETYFTPQIDHFVSNPHSSSSKKGSTLSQVVDVAKIVHVATPMPEKVIEYEARTWSSGKKLFPSPPAMKTPGTARLGMESKTASSAGANKTASAPQFKVPKVTTSGGYKPPASRLPKAVSSLTRAPITSPVSQYIRGPVVAPRIAVVHAKNTFPSSKYAASKLLSPKHYFKSNSENNSPNVPAIKLPYVDYDTASSIKVVEHMETKQRPLPNNIKKLMPTPGAVYRHTGRVNIPDQLDGRQEVSILVSHDAIHD